MKYQKVVEARFLSRPNRFIAIVDFDGREEIVHVKNTGRCKELLIPGAKVYLSDSGNPLRKTVFNLIAVEKKTANNTLLINMDSQAPNLAAFEWLKNKSELFSKDALIRKEVTFASSRFDLYAKDGQRHAFLEVKGVTLEKDGVALFPDAPTLRGVKHIEELIRAKEEGYETYLLFIIQMKGISSFSPNDETHSEFGQALRKAEKAGVKILALDCKVSPDSLVIDRRVPIQL